MKALRTWSATAENPKTKTLNLKFLLMTDQPVNDVMDINVKVELRSFAAQMFAQTTQAWTDARPRLVRADKSKLPIFIKIL